MDGDEAFGSLPGLDCLPSPNSSHPASPYLSLPPSPHPAQAPMSTTTLDKPRILIGSLHSPADLVEGYFSTSGREGDLGFGVHIGGPAPQLRHHQNHVADERGATPACTRAHEE